MLKFQDKIISTAKIFTEPDFLAKILRGYHKEFTAVLKDIILQNWDIGCANIPIL